MILRIVIIFVIAGAIAGGIYFLVTREDKYDILVVKRQDIVNRYAAPGRICSKQIIDVGSKISGRVKEVKVEEGDEVKKGQVLVIIEHDEILAKIEEIKNRIKRLNAQRNLAGLTLARLEKLKKQEAVSQSEIDEARTEYDVIRAQIQEETARLNYAKSQYDHAFIKAPITGIVLRRYVEPGEVVSTHAPVVTIVDKTKIIIAQIGENDIEKIREKQEVLIKSESNPSTFYKGFIQKIAEVMQEKTYFLESPMERKDVKILEVEIALTSPCPLPFNTPVEVYCEEKIRENVIAIPLSYIFYEGDKPYVMLHGSSSGRQFIKIGKNNGEVAEVLKGISEGQKIIKRK